MVTPLFALSIVLGIVPFIAEAQPQRVPHGFLSQEKSTTLLFDRDCQVLFFFFPTPRCEMPLFISFSPFLFVTFPLRQVFCSQSSHGNLDPLSLFDRRKKLLINQVPLDLSRTIVSFYGVYPPTGHLCPLNILVIGHLLPRSWSGFYFPHSILPSCFAFQLLVIAPSTFPPPPLFPGSIKLYFAPPSRVNQITASFLR